MPGTIYLWRGSKTSETKFLTSRKIHIKQSLNVEIAMIEIIIRYLV